MACLTVLLRDVGRSCKAACVSASICSPGKGLELFCRSTDACLLMAQAHATCSACPTLALA